jgi:hypothetical protein
LIIIVIGHLVLILGDLRLLGELAKINTSYTFSGISTEVSQISK